MIKHIAVGLVAMVGVGVAVGGQEARAAGTDAVVIDGAAGDAVGLGTSCNNVDITVKNEKGDQIKVTKIGYQIDGNGTLHTEGLDNKEIGKNGGSKTWNNQNLQHAPEGAKLTFKIYFKNDKVGGWGSEVSQSFDRLGTSCTDGRAYTFVVK